MVVTATAGSTGVDHQGRSLGRHGEVAGVDAIAFGKFDLRAVQRRRRHLTLSRRDAEGQVPTASINGSSIELTEDGGVYSGSFAMPGQASTLVINTGTTGGGDDYNPIDTGN